MISGLFHTGSGLGNQLHRYVATRVIALDKGYEFGMIGDFKGDSFMQIDRGVPVHDLLHEFNEKKTINDKGVDIREYDSQVKKIHDFTLVDGEFQSEKYFDHHLDKVREWLAVEPMDMPDDLCVIGFRGGEYVGVPDLYLPRSYWTGAMMKMRQLYPNIKFHVVTDDVRTAQDMFAGLDVMISHEIGHDWRRVRYAKHLIIANSSFYILPALLGEAKEIIAPFGWARYNLSDGWWALPQNIYSKFNYVTREGKRIDGDTCKTLLGEYNKKHGKEMS